MKRLTGMMLVVVAFSVWVGLNMVVAAQTPAPEFQSTKDDFLKVFRQATGKSIQTRGLVTKGIPTKGPAEVVPDAYDKLVESPTARSLILFDFDSDRVQEESYPILQNLAEVLRNELPDIQIVVVGHTDSVGTDEYNLELSRRRAESVRNVLVSSYGVGKDRCIVRWYGEAQPLITDNTTDGRNRRVEFVTPQ